MADGKNHKVKCQKQEVTDCNITMMVVEVCGGGIHRNMKAQGVHKKNLVSEEGKRLNIVGLTGNTMNN